MKYNPKGLEGIITNMSKEGKTIYFCKEHKGVALGMKCDGVPLGYTCSEGGEALCDEDMCEGIAWILLWEDLGCVGDPFTNFYNQNE
jgi:hypothetical protein